MNIKQLRYFVAVARHKSVTQASTELAITQPAISRQIAMLEQEIGVPLLVRHPRGVSLTKAGELLLARSEYILRTLTEVQSEVSDLNSDPSGELRIGYPPALSKPLLYGPLQAFLTQFKKVRVQLQERFSDELRDMVLADELDFAIVSSRIREANLRAEPLLQGEIWLFGPLREGANLPPVTPAGLAGLPMLMPRRANTIRTMVEHYVGDAGRLNIVVESSSNQMIQDLMQRGFGYTAAPFSAHEGLLRKNRVFGARIPGLNVERFLIMRSDRATSRATEEFLHLLRRQVLALKALDT